MRSIAFRIGTKGEGGVDGYPLSLFVGDDAEVVRQLTDGSAPTASDIIPSDLAVINPPLHPATNEPLQALLARDYLLGPTAGTDLLERVGTLLFDVLNRPGVAPLWKQERDTAWAGRVQSEQEKHPALRMLLDVRAPELRLLPWELIRTGKNSLAQQAWWPLVRWQASQQPLAEAAPLQWPFRVLVVIGCSGDDKAIDWREELWALLLDSRNRIIAERLVARGGLHAMALTARDVLLADGHLPGADPAGLERRALLVDDGGRADERGRRGDPAHRCDHRELGPRRLSVRTWRWRSSR